MRHLDLFSGIGGFSLAADRVFGDVEHTFVEWDEFCTEVLKKHWPDAEYHKDIRQFVADTRSKRRQQESRSTHGDESTDEGRGKKDNNELASSDKSNRYTLLTGGFPCQPFSHAGRRKGADDDRYLWPPMLECVSLFRPEWIIAENVAGLASWNEGLVLETVCSDLEREGYEVQPFVIPACAIGAPHRRDRVWIVAKNTQHFGRVVGKHEERVRREEDAPDAESGDVGRRREDAAGHDRERDPIGGVQRRDWSEDWPSIAAKLCRVDDGLPKRLDRAPRLKALGNAIVPQVAEEIMRAMKLAHQKI